MPCAPRDGCDNSGYPGSDARLYACKNGHCANGDPYEPPKVLASHGWCWVITPNTVTDPPPPDLRVADLLTCLESCLACCDPDGGCRCECGCLLDDTQDPELEIDLTIEIGLEGEPNMCCRPLGPQAGGCSTTPLVDMVGNMTAKRTPFGGNCYGRVAYDRVVHEYQKQFCCTCDCEPTSTALQIGGGIELDMVNSMQQDPAEGAWGVNCVGLPHAYWIGVFGPGGLLECPLAWMWGDKGFDAEGCGEEGAATGFAIVRSMRNGRWKAWVDGAEYCTTVCQDGQGNCLNVLQCLFCPIAHEATIASQVLCGASTAQTTGSVRMNPRVLCNGECTAKQWTTTWNLEVPFLHSSECPPNPARRPSGDGSGLDSTGTTNGPIRFPAAATINSAHMRRMEAMANLLRGPRQPGDIIHVPPPGGFFGPRTSRMDPKRMPKDRDWAMERARRQQERYWGGGCCE